MELEVQRRQLPMSLSKKCGVGRKYASAHKRLPGHASSTCIYNSKGPFHGRARYHSPSSLLIYSMESGDLRANYLSATRKVSHIQNSGHGPVVSSSSADIVVLIRVIFEYARPDGQPRPPMPNILKCLIGRARLASTCT